MVRRFCVDIESIGTRQQPSEPDFFVHLHENFIHKILKNLCDVTAPVINLNPIMLY